jgi:hypothetical protein
MQDNIYEKLDIVLQGPYDEFTNEIISDYLQLPFVNKVILSCWENTEVTYPLKDRFETVLSKIPFSPGTDNRNLQIVCSLAGLQKVTTDYAIKMRSDQKYTHESMLKMYDFFIEHRNEKRIFVPGMYPHLLFHPRDHIFWGKTEHLITMFDIPLEYNGLIDRVRISKDQLWKYYGYYTRTETYIGAHYCSNFDDRIKIFLLQPEKYLYDYAPDWQEAYEISNTLSREIFKSFPREGIDLSWPKKNLYSYPYDSQKQGYNECWHEDGL